MTKDPQPHILDTLDAREARFTVLHKRVPLPHGKRQDNGLSEAFVASLDRSQLHVVRPGDPPVPAPLSFAAAWGRLRTEEPLLASAVEATVIGKMTVRDAVPVLGASFSSVARRKGAGLAALSIWTGVDVSVVARQVCDLTV